MYSQRKLNEGLKIKIKRATSTGRRTNRSGSGPRYQTPGDVRGGSLQPNDYGMIPVQQVSAFSRADAQAHTYHATQEALPLHMRTWEQLRRDEERVHGGHQRNDSSIVDL